MVLSFAQARTEQETEAKDFCIAMQREFSFRAGFFKSGGATNADERRWIQEGIRPIEQFESLQKVLGRRVPGGF